MCATGLFQLFLEVYRRSSLASDECITLAHICAGHRGRFIRERGIEGDDDQPRDLAELRESGSCHSIFRFTLDRLLLPPCVSVYQRGFEDKTEFTDVFDIQPQTSQYRRGSAAKLSILTNSGETRAVQ